MLCEKCFHKELKKDKERAMKNYTKKLEREKYVASKQTKRK